MKKIKRKLTMTEEFEIMKLVLDKFLWIAAIMMMYGLFLLIDRNDVTASIYMFIISIVILLLFMFLIIKEYEISK